MAEVKRLRKRRIGFWDPWEDIFGEFPGWPARPFLRADVKAPLLDIEDMGDKLLVVIDMPGVNKEDIEVNIEPKYLSVSAESKFKKEEKEKNYYYQERSYTGFSRSITLPEEVIPDKVRAEYQNGVLKIYLPKAKPAEKKRGMKVKVE